MPIPITLSIHYPFVAYFPHVREVSCLHGHPSFILHHSHTHFLHLSSCFINHTSHSTMLVAIPTTMPMFLLPISSFITLHAYSHFLIPIKSMPHTSTWPCIATQTLANVSTIPSLNFHYTRHHAYILIPTSIHTHHFPNHSISPPFSIIPTFPSSTNRPTIHNPYLHSHANTSPLITPILIHMHMVTSISFHFQSSHEPCPSFYTTYPSYLFSNTHFPHLCIAMHGHTKRFC